MDLTNTSNGGHVPNKAQFIELLADRFEGDKKRAAAALEAVIETVYANVSKGEKVALTGFGIFEKRDRRARTARNPATGATVQVKKTSVPAFRPGAEFRAITSGAKKLAKVPARAAASRTAPVKKAAAAKAAPVLKKAAAKVAAVAAPAKKAPAKKAAAPAKAPAKKAAAPAKKAAAPAKKAPAKKAPAKKAAR
jgi:DNA-binding protein HU-beta